MKVKLSQEDRFAIDLVLEHRADGSVPQECIGKITPSTRKRVKRVERILEVLSVCPVEEPGAKLVAATMKHIRRHEHDQVATTETPAHGTTVSHSMFSRPLQ